MEKISKIINKNENIFIILLIAISLIGVVFNVTLDVNDELWNFQNIYKMYNEFEIYKDANVICTPLFFYLGKIIFNILGANFFVFRIYNIFIFLFYYFMTYKILRELGINIKISTISMLMLIMFDGYVIPRVMANYNSLAVAFSLLGVYLLIKNKCVINTKNIIVQTIISFLIILTKQNIGAFYLVALTIVILVKNKKNKTKVILQEVGILIVLSAIFLIVLKINGLLDGFINYTILGMGQFTNENISIFIPCIIIDIAILLINLFVSVFLIKQKQILINKEEKNNLFVLNCFSIALSLLIYPIVNVTHLLFAINLAIVLLIYIFSIIIRKSELELKKVNSLITLVCIILILVDITVNIYCFINWSREIFDEQYVYNYNQPFFGAIIENEIDKDIEKVTNYIEEKENEGKDVIIFSSRAALYMVPLKQSNGLYDLPFNGNFGDLDEQDIEEDLNQKENTLILIEKTNDENSLRWQENKNIYNYIKENFKYCEDINEFEVYAP